MKRELGAARGNCIDVFSSLARVYFPAFLGIGDAVDYFVEDGQVIAKEDVRKRVWDFVLADIKRGCKRGFELVKKAHKLSYSLKENFNMRDLFILNGLYLILREFYEEAIEEKINVSNIEPLPSFFKTQASLPKDPVSAIIGRIPSLAIELHGYHFTQLSKRLSLEEVIDKICWETACEILIPSGNPVKGKVVKIERGWEALAPNAKERVLVTYEGYPLITPQMIQANALVVEKGGLLSHAFIVAREFGKPLVKCDISKFLNGEEVEICFEKKMVHVYGKKPCKN